MHYCVLRKFQKKKTYSKLSSISLVHDPIIYLHTKKSKKWKQRLEKSLNSKLQKSFPGYLYHFLQWFALFCSPQFSFQFNIFFCCILYQFSIIILPQTRLASEKAWNYCIFQHRWSNHFLFFLKYNQTRRKFINLIRILFLFIFLIKLHLYLQTLWTFTWVIKRRKLQFWNNEDSTKVLLKVLQDKLIIMKFLC